jgi:hypothetical protein
LDIENSAARLTLAAAVRRAHIELDQASEKAAARQASTPLRCLARQFNARHGHRCFLRATEVSQA